MNQKEKIDIVQAMQNYIKEHADSDNLDSMYENIGYSKRHADRLFSELLHMTPREYIRKVVLSDTAKELLETDNNIIDIALDSGYETHEGFTRAFKRYFHTSPDEYRKCPKAIPMFTQYPVWSYYAYLKQKERLYMNENTMICTVMPMERQKRKLIILRSVKAEGYWSFCEEKGCEWEGILNSIPEKMDCAAILELPASLIKEGTSATAAGIEVPIDYDKELPEGYEMVELEAGMMLYFKSEPYEDEKDFGSAIGCAMKAQEQYNPEEYGYEYDFENAPKFNFGASPEMGAKLAFPVKKLS